MITDDIRILLTPWRALAGYPLVAVALGCCAQSARADDAAPETSRWQYRDYLLYSARPSLNTFNPTLHAAQINVGDFLQTKNLGVSSAADHLSLSASFDTRADWESIRYGLGVFTNLPQSGQFHFNLYVRPNAKRPGFRYQLQTSELLIATNSGHQNWSIGGFVDYGRGGRHEDQHTRIGVAPQLLLNLSPLFKLPGDAQASVQYAYWRSAMDDDAPQNRALQMALRWRF